MVLYQVQNPHPSKNLLNTIFKTHTFNSAPVTQMQQLHGNLIYMAY